jgi:TolA-binding protein
MVIKEATDQAFVAGRDAAIDYLQAEDYHIPRKAYEAMKELTTMRMQREAEYRQQTDLLQQLKSMDQTQLKKALPIAVTDSQLNTLESELDLAEQNLVRLRTERGESDPKYKNAKESVGELNRKIEDRAAGIMVGLESKVASSKAYLDSLKTQVDTAQKTDIETAQRSAPYFAAKEKLEQEKRWRQAGERLASGQSEVGRRFFHAFIRRFPEDPRSPRAYLEVGRSFALERQFPRAAAEFQRVLDVYPRSAEVPEAMWQLSMAFFELPGP